MPHTLHKSKKIQQNNPKGNKCTETTPQQLLPDKKGQQFDKAGTKDESKQQNKSTHTNQHDYTQLDLATMEGHTEETVAEKEGQKKKKKRPNKKQRERLW